jgi:hypothetical protein
MTDIGRIDVHVDAAPHPGLIRSRIEAALTGRATESGPERAIGDAVAAAVQERVKASQQEGGPGC